ncbi:MAG: type IV toxin-antitoxin system AbiEi family antitoxin domain-containing protein [Candidatus Micrarchaeaceae archaeon]
MTKYINDIRENFDDARFPVFTLTDVRVLLSGTSISKRYLKILINHMLRAAEITRISRGIYTFHDNIEVVGFAFRPFYYGLEDALSYLNLWTQSTNPVVMTGLKVREGSRKFKNSSYTVKSMRRDLFFGFNFIRKYDMWIPVSDVEKTLIDLVYYGHDARPVALAAIRKRIDLAKLDEYLSHYGKTTKKKVYSCIGEISPSA